MIITMQIKVNDNGCQLQVIKNILKNNSFDLIVYLYLDKINLKELGVFCE